MLKDQFYQLKTCIFSIWEQVADSTLNTSFFCVSSHVRLRQQQIRLHSYTKIETSFTK